VRFRVRDIIEGEPTNCDEQIARTVCRFHGVATCVMRPLLSTRPVAIDIASSGVGDKQEGGAELHL
jgi:hypothetical protein